MLAGFSTENYFAYHLYEKTWKESNEFVSLRRGERIIKEFNKCSNREVVENKAIFGDVFKDYTKRNIISTANNSYEDFKLLCKKNKRLIIKPSWGCNGNKIFIIDATSEQEIKNTWQSIKNREYVIEEVLEQDGILHDLNPKTLNTIRVNVFNNHGDARIINAILRSGQGDVVTDNICSGGCVCEIDIKTGVVMTDFVDLSNHVYKSHPLTGVTMNGQKIPSWSKICDTVIKISKLLPDVGYQSWDIAVIKDGDVAVVEGNTYGNFNIQQVPQMRGVRKLYEGLLNEYRRKD